MLGEDLSRTAETAKRLRRKAPAPIMGAKILRSRTGFFHRIGGNWSLAAVTG
jgi:hypothetical protein